MYFLILYHQFSPTARQADLAEGMARLNLITAITICAEDAATSEIPPKYFHNMSLKILSQNHDDQFLTMCRKLIWGRQEEQSWLRATTVLIYEDRVCYVPNTNTFKYIQIYFEIQTQR